MVLVHLRLINFETVCQIIFGYRSQRKQMLSSIQLDLRRCVSELFNHTEITLLCRDRLGLGKLMDWLAHHQTAQPRDSQRSRSNSRIIGNSVSPGSGGILE